MAKMDAFNLKRLKEEQEKAVIETDNKLEQWNKFRTDYVALRERLRTLPNKTIHNVMVPFGSLAFMPGQLVHTNEILVLLGDNYFVERSASQAVDIVTRRMKSTGTVEGSVVPVKSADTVLNELSTVMAEKKVDENIQALRKQREMLTPRAQFTSEMIDMASGAGEVQEIVEEYDEERERQWRERHREYLHQAGEKQMKEKLKKEKERQTGTAKTDADYWDILDRLEQQENEREELENIEEPNQWQTEQHWGQDHSQLTDDSDRYAESKEDSSSFDDDDDDDKTEDEDSTDDEEEEDTQHSQQRIITFSHTKHDGDHSPSQGSAAENEGNTDVINSPADLYRFVKIAPKSILKTQSKDTARRSQREGHNPQKVKEKRVTFNGKQAGGKNVPDVKACPGAGDQFADEEEKKSSNFNREPRVQAFSDTVVERKTPAVYAEQPANHSTVSSSVSKPQEVPTSSRPVSKFRAARQAADAGPIVSSMFHSQDQVDPGTSSAAIQGASNSARPVSKFRASRMKQGGES